eukprot:Hpha_TRINITY_DN4091_c0_g1::TRINITY_DN4091_c0_g1_i1::g.63652::m.63652
MGSFAKLMMGLAVLGFVGGAQGFDPVNTVNLTDADFAERVWGGDTNWFIMFWAPWCGHCKRVKPIFAEASRTPFTVQFGMVDCTSDDARPICQEYNVTGYPTLKYSVRGKELVTYSGGRDLHSFQIMSRRVQSINNYVKALDAAAVQQLQGRDELVHFVFCTPSGQPTPTVRWIAERSMGYLRCLYITTPVTAPVCGGETRLLLFSDVGVRRYVPEDDAPDWTEGEEVGAGQEAAVRWIGDNRHLVVDKIDQTNFHHIVGRAKRPWICMYIADTSEMNSVRPVLQVLRTVATSEEGSEYGFGWVDGRVFSEWVADFATPDSVPFLLLLQPHEQVHLIAPPEVAEALNTMLGQVEERQAEAAEEAVREWLRRASAGELLPQYQGAAGYLFHALRAVGLSALNPYLSQLRKHAESDVLFLAMILMVFTLVATVISSTIRTFAGLDNEPEAFQTGSRAAPVQDTRYEQSRATPPGSPATTQRKPSQDGLHKRR